MKQKQKKEQWFQTLNIEIIYDKQNKDKDKQLLFTVFPKMLNTTA